MTTEPDAGGGPTIRMSRTVVEMMQRDARLRMIVDSSCAHVMDQFRDADPDWREAMHLAAHAAAALAVCRVVDGDAELKRARTERDHYRRLALHGLDLTAKPPRQHPT